MQIMTACMSAFEGLGNGGGWYPFRVQKNSVPEGLAIVVQVYGAEGKSFFGSTKLMVLLE